MAKGTEPTYKLLKIIVPAFQVALVGAVFGASKAYPHERFLEYYVYPLRELVLLLNLPVAVAWIIVFFPLGWLDRLGNYLPAAPHWVSAIGTIVGFALFTTSVALFWYLVVTEVELRARGKSKLRFRGWFGEVWTVCVFCLGAIALFWAYQYSATRWYYQRTDGLIGSAIIGIWGIVFVAVAVDDIVRSGRRASAK